MPPDRYTLDVALRRTLRVYYPLNRGQLTLRSELDWEHDLIPCSLDPAGSYAEFVVETNRPFFYVKPCLRTETEVLWAAGAHSLVLTAAQGTRDLYPFFFNPEKGKILDVLRFPSKLLDREHSLRVYLPPGYEENPLRSYPVLYMHDGKNLFFPEEAFLGRDWGVNEKLALLDSMNAVDQMIVVGIYAANREVEYTQPGYEVYGQSIVEEAKPYIDAEFRTQRDPESTGVMGSSLGGVVSFFMAWEWPHVFGTAACLSSTFSLRDNLIDRVLTETRREINIYIDSGWPGDNYEVSLAMVIALVDRGYEYGGDFVHYVFPMAEHAEPDWGARLHLPLQFFAGLPAVAARRNRKRRRLAGIER